MDSRTITVAKLLHSARRGRTEGGTDPAAGQDGDEGEGDFHGGDAGLEDDLVYGEANVNATPRTIEVAANSDVNPVYREAIATLAAKGGSGSRT